MSTVEVCIPSADFSFLSLPPNKSEGQGHRIPPLLRKDGAPLDRVEDRGKGPKAWATRPPRHAHDCTEKSLSSSCPLLAVPFWPFSPFSCRIHNSIKCRIKTLIDAVVQDFPAYLCGVASS